jgi:hypothetical protein
MTTSFGACLSLHRWVLGQGDLTADTAPVLLRKGQIGGVYQSEISLNSRVLASPVWLL